MKQVFWLCVFISITRLACAQSFEIQGIQENYRGLIGETVRAPLRLKNLSAKPVTIAIRRISAEIGGTQKNYFCIGNDCFDQKLEEYIIKIEAGHSFNLLQISLEAGLVPGSSVIRYQVFNRDNPSESMDLDLNFTVEEKAEKENIYHSRHIILHNVYPNPVSDYAFAEYKVLDDQAKAKIIIHNILGNAIEEYPLPPSETKVKIRAEFLNAGIYFYTLYLDNEGLITRKLIVKK
jgi:hypothetical protein